MTYSDSLEYYLESRGFRYSELKDELLAYEQARPLTQRENALLGMIYFRTSYFREAQHYLSTAVILEGPDKTEAAIELAGAFLGEVRLSAAEQVIDELPSNLTSWEKNMLLRRRGLVATLQGDTAQAIGLLEQAWRGFVADNTPRGKGISGHILGGLLTLRGEYAKAQRYFSQTIEYARISGQPLLLIDALAKQFISYIYADDLSAAQGVLDEMKATTGALPTYFHTTIVMCEVVFARAKNRQIGYRAKLLQLGTLYKEMPHPEIMLWLAPIVLDSVSLAGGNEVALKMLNKSLPDRTNAPITVQITEAVILTRMGGHRRAAERLAEISEQADESGQRLDKARANLYLANALFKSEQHLKVPAPLIEGIREIVALGSNFLIRDDLNCMKDLLKWARIQESTRPFVQLLEAGRQRHGDGLTLTTLGKMRGLLDGQSLHFRLDESEILLILTYIYMRPNSTYEQIAEAIFPDKSSLTGRSYARQSVMLLRQELGEQKLVTMQPSKNKPARVRLEGLDVNLDLEVLFQAIEAEDFDAVFAVYHGRFAPQNNSSFVTEIVTQIESSLCHAFDRQIEKTTSQSGLAKLLKYATQFRDVAIDNPNVRNLYDKIHRAMSDNHA
ncbi:hypothetical protein [Deinococcus fonticola]|uniref:hypothetical protein n=1 Tax=Deinococcus fonticola TaxID=2528713 RepID=UPI00107511D3|nr:hypothetical protein [Deinococcus fonticola]